MLKITKSAVSFDEEEMIELEQIIIDRDEKEALRFLRKSIYGKIARSQRGTLQPDLSQGS